jgi:hypothetical protein
LALVVVADGGHEDDIGPEAGQVLSDVSSHAPER